MAPVKPRARLREAIIDHLQQAGSDSISGITRALGPIEGSPVHRLTVAGYLAALTDEGLLKEVERPPSKHYQVADPDEHISLHQRTGRIVAGMQVPAPERSTLVVAVLERVLDRPIFQAELQHAGFPRAGPGIEEIEATDDERREYRALFRRRHGIDLQIPRGDPLLRARAAAVRPGAVQEALRRIILSGLPGARHLILERGDAGGGVQTQLAVADGEGPEAL